MVYSAVYARCKNGFDMLTGEKRMDSTGGYKVHTFTNELRFDPNVDLAYLNAILQKTIPADKDTLKEDGFFFSAMESGYRFVTCFHYVTDAFRNFFVTQSYVDKFESVYAFELFKRNDLWNAREKDENFYLTAEHAYLAPRASLESSGASSILSDAIQFIQNGRKQVFLQALSFLLSQYALPESQRKYLVIRDKSEKEIEYWIAAFSSALSPRMASALTFATRMESIQNTNRYAIDASGHYQKNGNFQENPDSLRRIAMIVGAVDADRSSADLRVLANSPFVVLNGNTLTLSVSADVSDPYYEFAASLSSDLFTFCREFVQAFGYNTPSKEIFDLYKVYDVLVETPSDDAYADALKDVLSRPIVEKKKLRWLYEQTKKMIISGEHSNLETMISLADSLKKLAGLLGITGDIDVEDEIVDSFEKVLFRGTAKARSSWWSLLKRSQFAVPVSKFFTQREVLLRDHEEDLQEMNAEDFCDFIGTYLDMQSVLRKKDVDATHALCVGALSVCCAERNLPMARKLVASVNHTYGASAQEVWNLIIGRNDELSAMLLELQYPEGGAFPEDLSMMLNTCALLHKDGKIKVAERIIFRSINSASNVQIKDLLRRIEREPFFAKIDRGEFYRRVDLRTGINLKDREVARTVQSNIQKIAPYGVRCTNSAHIVALDVLRLIRRRASLEEALLPYYEQGFPSVDALEYINELCDSILKIKFSDEDATSLFRHFTASENPAYFRNLVAVLYDQYAKKSDLWNIAIKVASSEKKQVVRKRSYDAIVDALVERRASRSSLEKAAKHITSEASRKYFSDVTEDVMKKRGSDKKGGFLSFLFGKNVDQ